MKLACTWFTNYIKQAFTSSYVKGSKWEFADINSQSALSWWFSAKADDAAENHGKSRQLFWCQNPLWSSQTFSELKVPKFLVDTYHFCGMVYACSFSNFNACIWSILSVTWRTKQQPGAVVLKVAGSVECRGVRLIFITSRIIVLVFLRGFNDDETHINVWSPHRIILYMRNCPGS